MSDDLAQSVTAAVGAMSWLTDADLATVELAKTYAKNIDDALATNDADAISRALFLGPHLLKLLGELGGTPRGRQVLDVKEQTRGKLASVRDLRDKQAPTKKRGRSA